MPLRLVQRRTIWLPTFLGWFLLLVIGCVPVVVWFFWGEGILALTERQPADVLVVEGWIGPEGVRAAYHEYIVGGYKFVVAAGGLTGERWNSRRWNYADEAAEQLTKLGVPPDRLLVASSRETEAQRTFEMAVAAHNVIGRSAIHSINVFTRGAHARRSRLIFQKVFGSDNSVGVISWKPPMFSDEPWWRSSDRAEDLIKETVGYIFELLANSGRFVDAAPQHSSLMRNSAATMDSRCAPARAAVGWQRLTDDACGSGRFTLVRGRHLLYK
jgi:uncharacterized SAM-binding protein YcdF (DUF218 family)